MPIDRKLLEILRCPVTKQPLFPLPADKLEKLNAAIAAGTVTSRDGSVVGEPLQEALITRNGLTIYRIDDGIPIMLEDQSIPADQVEGL